MAKKSTPSKGNVVGGFLAEVRNELRQVTWPTKKEALNLTAVVVAVSVGTGALLVALDYLFVQLMGLIIK